jgi:hypothetical protein
MKSPPIGVIVELPQMHNLIDRTGVGLEVAKQLPVMLALLKGRKADLLIELYRLGHCADPERIGSQFIEGHRALPFRERFEPPTDLSQTSSALASPRGFC